MDLLVVGCGYLGRRVASTWPGRVWALTRSPERAADFAAQGWQPVVGDVCEPDTLQQLPAVDAVLYAVGFDRSAGRSQLEVAVNGVDHVLARIAGRCRRFVYVSSTSVYGQSDGGWVDENSRCDPVQPGGQCALAAEQRVREACAAAQASILRLAGIYGPQRVLAKVETLRAGEMIAGRGDAWLNLIHVADAATVASAALTRADFQGTWLVSDDLPVTREEYYTRLASLVGAPPPRFDAGAPSKRGAGGLNKRCSNARLLGLLGHPLQFPTCQTGLVNALSDSTISGTGQD
jgi:nucleoside-diphosphate-sugar epimerase